jgi:hypothetical protein
MNLKEKLTAVQKHFIAINDDIQSLNNELSSGPGSFYFEKVIEYIDGLFSFAKFKPEFQNVVMAIDWKDIENNAPGWESAKNWFYKGAAVDIVGMDYRNKQFVYEISFRDDKQERRYVFPGIPEKWLRQ